MPTPQKIAESAQAAGQKAHGGGDLVTAEKLYRRALAHSESAKPEIYANYGALLRELKKPNDAAAVYRRGLKHYPEEIMLIKNFANLLLQEGQATKALALYLKADSYSLQYKPGKLVSIQRLQAQALTELGQSRLALDFRTDSKASDGKTLD